MQCHLLILSNRKGIGIEFGIDLVAQVLVGTRNYYGVCKEEVFLFSDV